MKVESEEVLGIGAMTVNPIRKTLTPAQAIERARELLATDRLSEEGRRIMAALVSGIEADFKFPKPADPMKRFTV